MEEVNSLLEDAIKLIPSKMLEDLPPNRLGIIYSLPFESKLWAMGEQLRQLIQTDKKFQFDERQIKLLLKIIQNKQAKRGRQSFVMLLGKRKYAYLAPQLIPYLDDPCIALHIFDTIYKMRALGYKKEFLDFQKKFKPLANDRKKIQNYLNDFQ
ncbi:hypothetical protein [Isobaculum melis]|uniref:Uncharacterized protein n=1 Tax=Isobaculum melis TaxID=142588 RepID=A0A1H9TCR2_9LACT|nr:hypothetical protein [Isobaculum melis]SER94734.1 hypothetical protein SAMN04488559_11229 [Isobaculum melis]